ncbi:MAG: PaaI family thioesterase [Actinomycetota bacterium]|nr:PaaI family thioesterase [Actinomycetota bacterium]
MAWYDDEPVRGGFPDPKLVALSGLERMQAGLRNQMPPPPTFHLFGNRLVAASPASVTFSMPCSEWLQTDVGIYFAGVSALVADAALGSAVLVTLGPAKVVVTSDLSFNFFRQVGVTSRQLICRARPIEVGRTLGVAEGLVEDGEGRIVAHCTTRCFIKDLDVPPFDGELPVVDLPTYDTPDPYLRPVPDGAVKRDVYESMPFIDIIKSWKERPLSPSAELFALTDLGAEPGSFTTAIKATPWMASPAGTVYGGVLAYMADSILTGALSTTLGMDESGSILDLKVQFVRPVWPDGREIVGDAHVTYRGKGFAAARGEMKNADGKTVVLMTSSARVRSGTSWGSLLQE